MFELLVLTDPDAERPMRTVIAEALEAAPAGRVAVLLRAPRLSARALWEEACALRELTLARGAPLLIHRRADLASLVRAEGVHLPERGIEVDDVRRLFGDHALVGVSRHDAEGLVEGARSGASFATLSPVRAVPGKGVPLGWANFAAMAARAPLPVVAMGGLGPEDVAPALRAGAKALAVMRSVSRAASPAEAIAAIVHCLDRERATTR